MATAFGPEGCVILAMLAKIAPETYVFNLETGYQFQETLDLRDRIAEKYGIEVDLLQPELTVAGVRSTPRRAAVSARIPNQCCFDRKIKTLQRASQVMHAWMSGIRRDQSADRAQAAIVGWDKKFGLVKISPLANWTKKDVWKRITDEDIPYNPLHDQGYPSIGCWPCTRAVGCGRNRRTRRPLERHEEDRVRPALDQRTGRQRYLKREVRGQRSGRQTSCFDSLTSDLLTSDLSHETLRQN